MVTLPGMVTLLGMLTIIEYKENRADRQTGEQTKVSGGMRFSEGKKLYLNNSPSRVMLRGSDTPGLHKTGIRGIKDTRQNVHSKTNYIENKDKKGGSRFLNIRQLMKK